DGELGETGSLVEDVLDFDSFFLENVEIGAEDFYREGALEASEGFVDGVFGGLGVIEDDAGIGFEFFLDVNDELLFRMDRAFFPRRVTVRFQADIKLAVEEAGGISAVIGTAEFGADDGNLRVFGEQVADLRSELAGVLE